MVSVPSIVSSAPTVSKPFVSMTVSAEVLPDTAQVTLWSAASSPNAPTTAWNCTVFPIFASPSALTVTAGFPEMPESRRSASSVMPSWKKPSLSVLLPRSSAVANCAVTLMA